MSSSEKENVMHHQDQALRASGENLADARAVAILLHGRGSTANSILSLADEIDVKGVAYLAPQAHGMTWYPYSFLAPISENEPALSSALRAVSDVVTHVNNTGIGTERIVLIGFSQGACLALEFAARNATRFGGVAALSGGLIGMADRPGVRPPADKLFDYDGDLAGTPVFVGCSDVDPHIPLARVRTTVGTFEDLGAEVTDRIYAGKPHSVNEDEIEHVRRMLASVLDVSLAAT